MSEIKNMDLTGESSEKKPACELPPQEKKCYGGIFSSLARMISGLFHPDRVKCTTPAWKPVFKLWIKKSAVLIWGSVLYNLFAAIVISPLLSTFFPELTPWEHVKGFFSGHSRLTCHDLLPYVGPGLWIAGNAFIFAWMNKNLADARKETGAEPVSKGKE